MLAKTLIINRSVVSFSDTRLALDKPEPEFAEESEERSRTPKQAGWAAGFWGEVFSDLVIDDAEQRLPPPRDDNPIIRLPTGNVWLRCYLRQARNEGGIYLDGKVNRSPSAVEIIERINSERDAILEELNLPAESVDADGIRAFMSVRDLHDPAERERLVNWFRSTINSLVNAIRPRVIQIAADLRASLSE